MSFYKNSRTGFPEPSSSIIFGIIEFNQHLPTLIIVIVTAGWVLLNIITAFIDVNNVLLSSRFVHAKKLKITGTTVRGVTLLVLAILYFTLISVDEIVAPDLTIKITGHQWFWCYVDDFLQFKPYLFNKYKKLEEKIQYPIF